MSGHGALELAAFGADAVIRLLHVEGAKLAFGRIDEGRAFVPVLLRRPTHAQVGGIADE